MADLALPGTPKPKAKAEHPHVKASRELMEKAQEHHEMMHKAYSGDEMMNKAPPDPGMSPLGGKAQ